MSERSQENLTEIDGVIETVTSFDELYAAIRALGGIAGSRKEYEPEEIIGLIEEVRRGDLDVGYITRSLGIRQAVERLIQAEKPGE